MWARLQYNDDDRGQILIPYNPFEKYKVPRQGVAKKRAVDLDVVRRVMALPRKGHRYNLAKDCFLLSFFLMGMNSADLYNCDVLRGATIEYERTKTKDRRADRAEMHVDVDARIRSLFDLYRDETGARVFCFYKMYSSLENLNKAINIGLKEVGADVGVDGLTYYAARHSWATIARNDLGIDKGTIDDALDHVGGYSVLDLYIKKDFTQVNKANKAVIDYVLGE
jgi:integrase